MTVESDRKHRREAGNEGVIGLLARSQTMDLLNECMFAYGLCAIRQCRPCLLNLTDFTLTIIFKVLDTLGARPPVSSLDRLLCEGVRTILTRLFTAHLKRMETQMIGLCKR